MTQFAVSIAHGRRSPAGESWRGGVFFFQRRLLPSATSLIVPRPSREHRRYDGLVACSLGDVSEFPTAIDQDGRLWRT
jgi:hypothetical protein